MINFFKQTKLYFNYSKQKYYKNHFYNQSIINDKYLDIFDSIVKDGITIIPNFLSNEIIDKMVDETKEQLNQVVKNNYNNTKHFFFPNFGVYRILECDKISKSSNIFFDNKMIEQLAKGYVSTDVSSFQKMIEIRPDKGKKSIADDFHFDDWRHRFKSFLYLTDIDPDNGPLVYLKGSHKQGKWRQEKEFEYFRDGKSGSYGRYSKNEVSELKQKYNFKQIRGVCSKGTLIIADTRGLHKGTPIKNRKRILLANYFR